MQKEEAFNAGDQGPPSMKCIAEDLGQQCRRATVIKDGEVYEIHAYQNIISQRCCASSPFHGRNRERKRKGTRRPWEGRGGPFGIFESLMTKDASSDE
ncbi:hypothetical protein PHLCEN_2v4619 [Hermanssonia centrifuga]|uniref:Uncharacterized protein n=1 Tax=Hermanssonia centrifuga TaxID=98765 RepID=A0A2R6PNL5_9APHY|nr:hypothetical protein PHLCEN_2v4619 [Hermanssonia centrifuga]